MSDLMLDVDQAGELKAAFRRDPRWTNALVKKLCERGRIGERDILSLVADVLLGWAEIVVRKHIIDLDAAPYCPDGWEVVEHVKGGQFEWDPAKVKLYLDEAQRSGSIKGDELQKRLKTKPCFNANLLDYLLANPHLIIEEWKGQYVFFWNTVYRSSDGRYVRYLCWDGGRWRWVDHWLDRQWYGFSPAAVHASN